MDVREELGSPSKIEKTSAGPEDEPPHEKEQRTGLKTGLYMGWGRREGFPTVVKFG
jgi:hypothetical protein